MANQDTEYDRGESITIAFGTPLPSGVSAGTPATTTVSFLDSGHRVLVSNVRQTRNGAVNIYSSQDLLGK